MTGESWMKRFGKLYTAMAGALVAVLLLSGIALADPGGIWPTAGNDLQNTRNQRLENRITKNNVNKLAPKWVLTTGGDVSATPAVDDTTVYVPDWAGNLYAINRQTGAVVWQVSIAAASGVPHDKARATPALAGDKVIIGTQGSVLVPGGGSGGWVLAFDKNTGALIWKTQADPHPAAIITQSATVYGNRVYVGVASLEEALAAFDPPGSPYQLSFRGSMLALDLDTGAIVWKTYTAPAGYTGNAVWGSSPAIDTKRGQLYIGTGNNYSVPQTVLDCVAAAGSDTARAACVPADDYFDSIMALDLATGAIRWATRAIPFDAWTGDCIPFFGDGANCPSPAGPDYDFGQAPALFTGKAVKDPGNTSGKLIELVGAGQKSGQYWALNPDTGAVVWVTQAGPGGTAGGLQWGSAVDGKRIYTANANSDHANFPAPSGPTSGVWSAIDTNGGGLLWQTRPPDGGATSGPVTTANGVVFGCSLDAQGHMYALDAASGAVLWSFASGGSCLSGAAISNGTIFWGSGYGNFNFGTANNKLYAFGLP
jgi:polyvinyl alcohol dehydrogenase (cytochrome)